MIILNYVPVCLLIKEVKSLAEMYWFPSGHLQLLSVIIPSVANFNTVDHTASGVYKTLLENRKLDT